MMREKTHQMMGYDRAITMFSPDGRLLQVEYAKKTVKQGTTAIGMVCSDGVLVVADKRIMDPLMVTEGVEKIFQIDDHMAAAVSGLVSDGRVLIERSQVKAQQHRVTFDAAIDVISIIKDVCDLKQLTTQSGGLRPFGVSLLVIGIDAGGMKLFVTEPSGIYFQYNAAVIGEGELDIDEELRKSYKSSMTVNDGAKLAVEALKKFLGKEFSMDRIEAAYIKADKKQFKKFTKEELKKLK
ncbi:archaeal proteasome endopeptidase complex subunit alpha [Candidatus Woesearchaeota archaeon]|nr:archaeal proteasome endopeptidase complex subunit alpha [Candidatus Woesearchaeota archaeon]